MEEYQKEDYFKTAQDGLEYITTPDYPVMQDLVLIFAISGSMLFLVPMMLYIGMKGF